MTAMSGQKVCPKCYKMNPVDLEACGGCGASLSKAHIAPAGGKRSIFGFVPTEKQVFEALDPATPKKVFENTQAVGNLHAKKADEFFLFKSKTAAARPWA